ncbi:MAG: hypothetical protein MZV64_46695 [Ignavibacteriales bacterium]|nr:hypothetical protein [Ignavibacteriales bacterium]
MIKKIIDFFKPDSQTSLETDQNIIDKNYKKYRWSVFLSSTIGYGIYYICRLSINVIKKPIIDEGLLTESQLGIIGSALFFSYAAGKLVNGFLSDRVNIRKFMATGLFISAIVQSCYGISITVYFIRSSLGIKWMVSINWFNNIGGSAC